MVFPSQFDKITAVPKELEAQRAIERDRALHVADDDLGHELLGGVDVSACRPGHLNRSIPPSAAAVRRPCGAGVALLVASGNSSRPRCAARMSVVRLTDDMKRIVLEQRLGYAATVCADGTPNLSPKGTTTVFDDDHLMFADIHSPDTVRNLQRNPAIELNVVDPIVRKGYRFKGPLIRMEGCTSAGSRSSPSAARRRLVSTSTPS